jgi:hypothetical protein
VQGFDQHSSPLAPGKQASCHCMKP